MRPLIVIAIVAAVVYWVQHRIPEPAFTGIPNYKEVRVVMQVGSREIEMVSYLSRDSSEPCQESERWFVDAALNCEDLGNCSVRERSCLNGLPDRYLPMFDKRRDTTAYLHLEHAASRREGVVLFWGLNESESIKVCQDIRAHLLARWKQDKVFKDLTARCIGPD